jgi:zinc D-Ala-D-Ala carboxypeptidase
MIRSSTAVRKGIDNTPNADQLAALRTLCVKVLEPVRVHFGAPVKVTSGFRCARLNKAVGGSGTSQHCFGEAADFSVDGVSDLEVARWIKANLKFDQLILEFPPEGWVHVSYGGNMRHQVLTAKRLSRGTKYIPGLNP